MGGATGSRECAPDDKLRDTHHVPTTAMGFAKGSTHPMICLTGKSLNSCPVSFAKIFRFAIPPNQIYIHRRLVPQRGGSRSSRTRGGMRWTQAAPKTRARTCG